MLRVLSLVVLFGLVLAIVGAVAAATLSVFFYSSEADAGALWLVPAVAHGAQRNWMRWSSRMMAAEIA
jgi:hypothetical protein